jgi:hypothetical protein
VRLDQHSSAGGCDRPGVDEACGEIGAYNGPFDAPAIDATVGRDERSAKDKPGALRRADRSAIVELGPNSETPVPAAVMAPLLENTPSEENETPDPSALIAPSFAKLKMLLSVTAKGFPPRTSRDCTRIYDPRA